MCFLASVSSALSGAESGTNTLAHPLQADNLEPVTQDAIPPDAAGVRVPAVRPECRARQRRLRGAVQARKRRWQLALLLGAGISAGAQAGASKRRPSHALLRPAAADPHTGSSDRYLSSSGLKV